MKWKPAVLAGLGLLLVLASLVVDTLLLSNPIVRNGFWTFFLLVPGLLLCGGALIKKKGWITGFFFALALFGTGIYTLTRLLPVPSELPSVALKKPFPRFKLNDQNGDEVSLRGLTREGPLVLVLFRGPW